MYIAWTALPALLSGLSLLMVTLVLVTLVQPSSTGLGALPGDKLVSALVTI